MGSDTEIRIQHDIALAPLTTMRVGGRARHFVDAESDDTVAHALAWADARGMRTWILGGGSNVVVPDEGIDGLVIRIETRGIHAVERGGVVEVTARAGEPWDDFVAHCVARGWAGIECLSAIPGSVGATPIQNVGAYGQAVADTISRVSVLDRRTSESRDLTPSECGFGYRDSIFKGTERDRFVVLAVTYALRPGGAPTLRYPELERRVKATRATPSLATVRDAVIAIRAEKSMAAGRDDENARSCGSFFKNPIVGAKIADAVAHASGHAHMPRYAEPNGRVKLSAAWLIEQSGLEKGHTEGAVGLSTKHALAVVCHEGATASAVLAFSEGVRERVRKRFGIDLEPEPNLWRNA